MISPKMKCFLPFLTISYIRPWVSSLVMFEPYQSSSLGNHVPSRDRNLGTDDRHNPNVFGRNSTNPSDLPYYSIRPSQKPVSSSCASSTGFIGNTTTNNVTLTYKYLMELAQNTTPDHVMSYIEIGITNVLIKTLYSQCLNSRLFVRERKLATSISLVGISSFPTDLDMTLLQGNCEASSSDNVCYPIHGAVTFYFTSENRRLSSSDLYSTMTLASNAIKTNMDDGSLNSVHPSIVHLKYVDDGNIDIVTPTAQLIQSERTSPVMIALVLLGVIASIAIAMLTRRRLLTKKARLEKEQILGSNDDSFEIVHSPTVDRVISEKQFLDGYDLSSEAVIVKIDRQISMYDRVWTRSSM